MGIRSVWMVQSGVGSVQETWVHLQECNKPKDPGVLWAEPFTLLLLWVS